jgi:chromosome segregation ATPase
MGTRTFASLDEAEQFMESEFIGTERQKRHNLDVIKREHQRIAQIMADHHAQTETRIGKVTDFAFRIADEGEERVDEVMNDLRDGRISAREAAKQLAAAKGDLNRITKEVSDSQAAEERAWSEVNRTPSEYRRDVAKRFPALFSGGRNQITLSTNDD